ncbi:hypothetical protein MXB_4602 [Myxobolus squamalis]|nr:hypothetical protein MXB_4602 [Myxobolus squamalis]
MAVELAALAIQSELGDYDSEIHQADYMKEVHFISSQSHDFMPKVEAKHRDLVGLTPGECEINFLKRIKYNDLYGIERHTVYDLLQKGSLSLKMDKKLDFTHVVNNFSTRKSYSSVFTSNYRYRYVLTDIFSGRTFYEASEDTSKLSRKKNSLKRFLYIIRLRAKTTSYSQRSRVGYIRIGSRVFAKAENGEYFKGIVVALSDKVYVKCDDGVTLAHQKNTTDGILYDSSPDPHEVLIGTRVIAHWPGISNFLPGNVNSIDGAGTFARYLVAFDDGDTHWNNIDQIRLLKPPMYFGPGSNTTYLQKKFSMLKTTTLVNAKIASASNNKRENTINNSPSSMKNDLVEKNIENDLENNENSILSRHPRTTSSNDKVD